MPDDTKKLANDDGGRLSDQSRQRSPDAVRHQKDALHHKFHNDPQPPKEEKRQQPQQPATAQKGDTQPSEGQPEIPKVGSRDALGG